MGRFTKKNKFGAKRTKVDGINFHSKAEADRYVELKTLRATGAISALETQVAYPIFLNGDKIGKYVPDFRYLENGKVIVEEVKGRMTDLARWKIKCFIAAYVKNNPEIEFRLLRV